MPHVEIIFNQLKKVCTDSVMVKKDLENFEAAIQVIREQMDSIIDNIQGEINTSEGETSESIKKKAQIEENSRKREALEICDAVLLQIKTRFSSSQVMSMHSSVSLRYFCISKVLVSKENGFINRLALEVKSFEYALIVSEKMVCVKAFASIHAVTLPSLKRIQLSIVEKGCATRDMRDKHTCCPRNYSKEATILIMNHVPVKDMHKTFLQGYYLNVPYKMYWKIFKTKFNIKFGYPRSDTCAECDKYQHTLSNKSISDADKASCKMLQKAAVFTSKKRAYKEQARAGEISCITATHSFQSSIFCKTNMVLRVWNPRFRQ
ncbi:unnamed protein product [Psylliodes chrysocephalus]|uniref:Uncharacterized protein n=1 Tax=Psylliodes chrysocephalus TaxID=3402493 RepID=A0A9P0CFM2_9CUCU|nr:unnamed protein product [Psylliodes chrysocephala]